MIASGRPAASDLAAVVAAFRAEIDDLVGGLDDLQIMLDHRHRVALVVKLSQHFETLCGYVYSLRHGQTCATRFHASSVKSNTLVARCRGEILLLQRAAHPVELRA